MSFHTPLATSPHTIASAIAPSTAYGTSERCGTVDDDRLRSMSVVPQAGSDAGARHATDHAAAFVDARDLLDAVLEEQGRHAAKIVGSAYRRTARGAVRG